MARPGALGPAQRRKVEKQELMAGKELAQVLAGEVRRARSARQPSTAVAGGGGQQVQVLLLDGAPRNMEQLEAFDSEVSMTLVGTSLAAHAYQIPPA